MVNDADLRYYPTYRQAEMHLICQHILKGESLGFIGMKGVGKSNLINFLRNSTVCKNQYFGAEADQVHFCLVDANSWQHTPAHMWRLIWQALESMSQEVPPPEPERVVPFADEERVLGRIRSWLRKLCQEQGHRVVFVLDDFDIAFEIGPLTMLEQFNELRNDGNRGRLSYLVFTKRLPHVLGRAHNLETASKFYGLFKDDIYALEPYAPSDAHQMLKYLNNTGGKPLSHLTLIKIHELAGGHAGLLRIAFKICAERQLLETNAETVLANHSKVREECLPRPPKPT